MKVIALNQGTEQWLQWRLDGVGGSDIAAICGMSPYRSRDDVLTDKVERRIEPPNFAMQRGTRLEPQIRHLFQTRTGITAKPTCIEHREFSWCRASLDDLAFDQFGVPYFQAEYKAPNWQAHELALTGVVPPHYFVQVQWGMFISGLKMAHYVSFNDGKKIAPDQHLAVVAVERDESCQQDLLEKATRFWGEVTARRKSR